MTGLGLILTQAAPDAAAAAADAAGAAAPFADTVAPLGGLSAVLTLALLVLRGIKQIRTEDVREAQRAAEAARVRANDAEKRERDQVAQIRLELNEVQRELSELRKEQESRDREASEQLREQEERHRRDRDTDHERMLRLVARNYRLEQHMAANGLGLPTDLDPARPDVRPRLSPDEDSLPVSY